MGIPTAEGYTPSGAASTKRGARGSRGTRRTGRDRPPPLLLRARVRLAGVGGGGGVRILSAVPGEIGGVPEDGGGRRPGRRRPKYKARSTKNGRRASAASSSSITDRDSERTSRTSSRLW